MAKHALDNTSILEDSLANNDDKLVSETNHILVRLKSFFKLG